MLELLDGMISECTKCTLYSGGRTKPYWTPMSIYGAVGEAPGKQEVEDNEPFVGKAGDILGEVMSKHGFRKEQFLIINSVNCRPLVDGRNGKPNIEQTESCYQWIRKYFTVLKPEKIITFGNFAKGTMGGSYSGIVSQNGNFFQNEHFTVPMIASVHPAYCIYNEEDGVKQINYAIGRFRHLR